MLKFPVCFLQFSFLALFSISVLALCGCGSRADQTSAQSTPVAAARPSTPAFTTALDTYIAREEPAYKWEKISEKQIGKNLVTTLKVTSQIWQGVKWTHRVEIARPEKIEFPGWALLYLSTSDGAIESILTQSLAAKMGAVTIHVTGMPNQPLFGKEEDALIAHTFSQYLQTDDETWPLFLPMTKGAIKAMDAVQEYSAQQEKPLDKFVVMGASKRGWTSWLVGATDTKNRIGGIIPLVYDNVNLKKQMPHQLESWGEYSPSIADYTRDGLQEKMSTPRGDELRKIIDPYTYRSRLTMPKLIINATNDPYWALDALNLYWNDLPAPKNVYYAPNAGHSMESDFENVFGTAAAWFRRVASGRIDEIRNIRRFESDANTFRVMPPSNSKAGVAYTNLRLWFAYSATRDFRNAKWQSSQMNIEERWHPLVYAAEIPTRETPYVAAFAEVQIKEDNGTLRLSSPIQIWNTRKTGQ